MKWIKKVIKGKRTTPLSHTAATGHAFQAARIAGQTTSGVPSYEIVFRPYVALFADEEPLHILHQLRQMGPLQFTVDTSPPEHDNPLLCNFSWHIHLQTARTQQDIWDVFQFAREMSDIRITKIDGVLECTKTS